MLGQVSLRLEFQTLQLFSCCFSTFHVLQERLVASQSVWGKVPDGFGENSLKISGGMCLCGEYYTPEVIFAVLPGIRSKAFSWEVLKSCSRSTGHCWGCYCCYCTDEEKELFFS